MVFKYLLPAVLVLALSATLGARPAAAWDYTLGQMTSPTGVWSINSHDLGITGTPAFSVTARQLHGGRQEGVSVIEIDNGKMKLKVCPTRGMDPLDAVIGNTRWGWNSPVKDIVNPAYMNLESREGAGWLDGFNELVVRCGYEWTGHPGVDEGTMLTLHGRAGNTPASNVKLTIDEKAPHTITLSGEIHEQVFKKVNFSTLVSVITIPNAPSFKFHDVLTNNGDYTHEYQVIYHSNFGTPVLGKGAKFAAPVKNISPFNEYAKKDLATWKTYRGPTRGFDEMVYNIFPYADAGGNTLAVLSSAAGDKGVSLGYNTSQLPVFSLWKNTDLPGQGYVTGLEPGTSLAYKRYFQHRMGLVPKIAPKATKTFDLTYTLLDNPGAVKSALQRVAAIQGKRKTVVSRTPLADETKPTK